MNVVRVDQSTHYAHAGAGKTLCGRRWSSLARLGEAVTCARCLDIRRRLGT